MRAVVPTGEHYVLLHNVKAIVDHVTNIFSSCLLCCLTTRSQSKVEVFSLCHIIVQFLNVTAISYQISP